jgi:hypothetical protein
MSTFRIQEFAKRAGVTVLAFNHYDRVKLLSPARRSQRGYRLHCREDLGRPERILALQRYPGAFVARDRALLNTLVARGVEPLMVTLRGSGRRCVSGATALIASCGPLNMHNGAHRTQRNQSGSSTRPS